ERALRIVRGVRWALLRQKAYPQRTYPPALPDVWTHELQARTKNITVTRPLDDNDGLYRQFADLEFEPESYRKFADRYGLLFAGYSPALWSYASFHACVRRALGLHVPSWVLEQLNPSSNDLTHKTEALDHRIGVGPLVVLGLGHHLDPPARLQLLIEHGCATGADPISGRLGIVIRPRNLMVAMVLQTIRHLSGEQERTGVKLLQCERCGEHFQAGTGTGRRTRSKFCSRKCGQEFRDTKRKHTAVGRASSSPDKAWTSEG